MAVVEELLRADDDGISFGNYELDAKAKKEDFEFKGDIYKVKTFKEITKLEKNEMFLYESVPGTTVINMVEDEKGVSFSVMGNESAEITLELEDQASYDVVIDGKDAGSMDSNMSGKLSISVEFTDRPIMVEVKKK